MEACWYTSLDNTQITQNLLHTILHEHTTP